MNALSMDEMRKLHQKKYRQQFGYFLAEGEHLVQELERAAEYNPALEASELYVTRDYQNWASRFKKNEITQRLMSQLSDTRSPQGIIACVPTAALHMSTDTGATSADCAERCIYLYQLQDPGNLGTILRTLAWFGGFRCLLSPGCVDPLNAKVVRASMGAVFHVPIQTDVPLAILTERFKRIASLDMKGEPLSSAGFREQQCLVFGNEARGVPRDLLQGLGANTFNIPGCGQVESLNVASVLNMCVYELSRDQVSLRKE